MSLPPLPEIRVSTHYEGCEAMHIECALLARIRALHKYARHNWPACMADEDGCRCECGLQELERRLREDGLL